MLPSKLYFKSIQCPFDANGLCRRPHCHMRHEISPVTDKPLVIKKPLGSTLKYSASSPSPFSSPSSSSSRNHHLPCIAQPTPSDTYKPTPIRILQERVGKSRLVSHEEQEREEKPHSHEKPKKSSRKEKEEKSSSKSSDKISPPEPPAASDSALRCNCENHQKELEDYNGSHSPKFFLRLMDKFDDKTPTSPISDFGGDESPPPPPLPPPDPDDAVPSPMTSESEGGDDQVEDELEQLFNSIKPSKVKEKASVKVEQAKEEPEAPRAAKRVAHQDIVKPQAPKKKKISAAQMMINRFSQGRVLDEKPEPKASELLKRGKERNAFSKPSFGSFKAGERKAHASKAAPETLPVLPADAAGCGTTVPFAMRQKYLKLIHVECEKLHGSDKAAAREEAVAEEKRCLEASGKNKHGYINGVVKSIQALRNRAKNGAKPKPISKATPHNQNFVTHLQVLAGKKGTIGTWSMENRRRIQSFNEIPDSEAYSLMSRYLMTPEQMEENGYPVPVDGRPGEVLFKDDRPKNPQPADKSKRNCDRCKKTYSVDRKGHQIEDDECVYHWGRVFRMGGNRVTGPRSQYTCCRGDATSDGCEVNSKHFADVQDEEGRKGFVQTMEGEETIDIFALDCEMCSTVLGNELTRVTVVNLRGQTVYESLVMPDNDVIDYNTRFSGITEDQLTGVKTKLRDVQAVLLSKFSSGTILIGHSLESDLKVLKLIHERVVDTSIVFPHKLGPPYKRALKNLAAEHLKRIIQDSVDGHDSAEDAIAALDLMKQRIKDDYVKVCQSKELDKNT